MAGASLLYIEDEENDVFFMKMAFERTGLAHTLHSVSNGKEAIAYLAGHGPYSDRSRYPLPAVILLDLNLPLISGFEVLQWLRQQPHLERLPVVVFSSSGRPEDMKKAQELGANDYLLKPTSGMGFSDVARRMQERWLVSWS
jgi:CheY-like chemotaxis protein